MSGKSPKTFKSFVESIIDPVRSTYSTQIFKDPTSNTPVLLPVVQKQVVDQLKDFEAIAKIKDYQLIGSILTKQYRNDADLDVNVVFEVPEDEKEAKYTELLAVLRMVNGRVVTGTRHPINYYIIMDKPSLDVAFERADNIYEIKTGKWIKQQNTTLPPVDVKQYVSKFRAQIDGLDLLKNRFNRDLIDYREYKSLSKTDATSLHGMLNASLLDLENDINALIDAEEDIHTKRRAAFAKTLTRDELESYGTHNRLPENILYKILEKYHYLDFINHLKDVIGDDRKLTHDEADRL